MTVRIVIAVATAAVLTVWNPAGSAGATPPEGDSARTDLANGTTQGPVSINIDGPATLVVNGLVIGPGAGSGWHTHPGTEFSAITDGSVTLQTATQCGPVTYGAGQAVFIPTGVPHRVFNEAGQDARVVITYTLPVGAPVRLDSPDVCAV
jgi:quercetin dioxygenase-like cupin family protein